MEHHSKLKEELDKEVKMCKIYSRSTFIKIRWSMDLPINRENISIGTYIIYRRLHYKEKNTILNNMARTHIFKYV